MIGSVQYEHPLDGMQELTLHDDGTWRASQPEQNDQAALLNRLFPYDPQDNSPGDGPAGARVLAAVALALGGTVTYPNQPTPVADEDDEPLDPLDDRVY